MPLKLARQLNSGTVQMKNNKIKFHSNQTQNLIHTYIMWHIQIVDMNFYSTT